MKKLLLILPFILATSACTTYDAYTGEQKTSATAKGAGVGAGVGAVLAYLRNKDEDSTTRRQRILQGAAVGGALGGGAGYYMDNQEAKLRKQLRGSGVSVQRDGDNINLIMPGNITFPSDGASIKPSFYSVLDSVTEVLKEYDRTIIVASGHTDSTGSDSYNQLLSEKRARSVNDYFLNRGILPDRLESVGFGESQPVASNETPQGREQNRRVELTLVPITS
ncbi:OmpA family protein [Proteobacteria bacterium 005FR1]|nr:OmpA family protein [Proteobacteria bacterium 005FR1]